MISEPESASASLPRRDAHENAPSERESNTFAPARASLARTGPHARELARIAQKVTEGARIECDEALFLHEHADMLTLGRLADLVRLRKHPEGIVTYIVDRNLNPTNVCITDCGFCAFYRRPGAEGEYVLSREEIAKRI